MIYDDSKYDMTDYIKKVIDNELNTIRMIYIEKKDFSFGKSIVNLLNSTKELRLNQSSFWHMNCFKKEDWKYEREWRLLAYNTNPLFLNPSIHCNIGILKPSAIYLGERISEFNRINLIEIARKKGIKIFQMKSKICKKTMKLVYEEIK